MAKINATYSSGYYISPDTDFRRLEEQQAAERKNQRKRGRDDGDGSDDPASQKAATKRQTFAIPFDLYCDHCTRRIPRGAHVYTNRRPTRIKYLNAIRVWELEIRCQYCSGLYYLQTDPETPKETGGYKCVRGCHRAEGDFLALNARNEAAKAQWEKERAEAEANPLAALERENEASRELAERNRRIEEDVLARADADDDMMLLAAMRRRRQQEEGAAKHDPSSSGAPPSTSSLYGLSTTKYTFETGADDDDGEGNPWHLSAEEMAAEEAEYEKFEADMTAQWQEAQERAAKQAARARADARTGGVGQDWFSAPGDGGLEEGEKGVNALTAALARYGGSQRSSESTGTAGRTHESSARMAVASHPPGPSGGRRNVFVAASSASDSASEEDTSESPGHEGIRRESSSPPPQVGKAKTKKKSVLSSLCEDDQDDD